jgi:hypothetical protein
VFYTATLVAQVAFYALALYGAVLEQRRQAAALTNEVFREAA